MKSVLVSNQDQKFKNYHKKGRVRITHLERNEIFYSEHYHPAPKIHKLLRKANSGISVVFQIAFVKLHFNAEIFFVE